VSSRLLLEKTDHVALLVKKTAKVLRSKVKACQQEFEESFKSEQARLDAGETWKKLDADQQKQILGECGLTVVPKVDVGSDDALLSTLQSTPLDSWQDKIDALPGRFANALIKAAKVLEPKSQRVSLPGATINNADDLDNWISEVRSKVEAKLAEGPVIL
jgi:hypothetical protein